MTACLSTIMIVFYINYASFLDQASLVKMNGYWHCSSLVDLMHDLVDLTSGRENELSQCRAILILCLALLSCLSFLIMLSL